MTSDLACSPELISIFDQTNQKFNCPQDVKYSCWNSGSHRLALKPLSHFKYLCNCGSGALKGIYRLIGIFRNMQLCSSQLLLQNMFFAVINHNNGDGQ